MRGLIAWVALSVIGFLVMFYSYNSSLDNSDRTNVFKHSVMYIGENEKDVNLPSVAYTEMPIRLLVLTEREEVFARITSGLGVAKRRAFDIIYREKALPYFIFAPDFKADSLVWGRLPDANANEVLAGFCASCTEKVTIGGKDFKIVGRLRKGFAVFANTYLLASGLDKLFDSNDENVQIAYLLKTTKKQLNEPSIKKEIKEAFPKDDFIAYISMIRIPTGNFCLYVAGFAILLTGGSGTFITAYGLGAKKISNNWLGSPLREIQNYKKLFIVLHAVIFGLSIMTMLLIYLLPEIQTILLIQIGSEFAGSGPLAIAGKAYLSQNITRAAAVTFLINFFIGSILTITIPSLILPGIGILMELFRSSLWGLLLAPSFDDLASKMLPHSWTLLFEGEAYILTAFFGLLVPIYLFQKSKDTIGQRYGLAMMMNLRGLVLVAIVLLTAAIYEAVEVILGMRLL
jgi:hypothetical protein